MWSKEADAWLNREADASRGRELRTLLAAIDNALRNGSYMTGANLALDILCERLDVERDDLEFDPLWARNVSDTGLNRAAEEQR